jgi:hypothetical protein
MAISYRPYEPQQEMLLPASLQDWLPKGHLAYFISDTIDALDPKAFCARYAGGGARNQPLHPSTMVKVLVYGYATGVFSSRKIERRLHEDLALRMLAAGNFPPPAHHRRLPGVPPEGTVGVVRASGQARPRDGPGQAGHGGHRRHQGQGQRRPPVVNADMVGVSQPGMPQEVNTRVARSTWVTAASTVPHKKLV